MDPEAEILALTLVQSSLLTSGGISTLQGDEKSKLSDEITVKSLSKIDSSTPNLVLVNAKDDTAIPTDILDAVPIPIKQQVKEMEEELEKSWKSMQLVSKSILAFFHTLWIKLDMQFFLKVGVN